MKAAVFFYLQKPLSHRETCLSYQERRQCEALTERFRERGVRNIFCVMGYTGHDLSAAKFNEYLLRTVMRGPDD